MRVLSPKPVPKAVDKSRDKSATACLGWRGGVCSINRDICRNWLGPKRVSKVDNKPPPSGPFTVKWDYVTELVAFAIL